VAPRLVVVFGAKGGLGRSAIAANLAIALARRTKKSTLLWDADWWGGGSLGSYLDLDPAPGHWRAVLLRRQGLPEALAEHASGVKLLAAPPASETMPPHPSELARLVGMLAEHHEWIVVDTTHPGLTLEPMVALWDLACAVLPVVTPDITVLHATGAILDHARSMRYPVDRVHPVLNRAGTVAELGADDVSDHLQRPLIAQVPSNVALVESLNRGQPLLLSAPQNPVSQALVRLGQGVAALPATDLSRSLKAWVSRAPQAAPPSPAPGPGKAQAASAPTAAPAASPAQPDESLHRKVAPDPRILELRRDVHRELVEVLKRQNLSLEYLSDPARKGELRRRVLDVAAEVLDAREDVPLAGRAERVSFLEAIADEAVGYGPLEPFLQDARVSEIMVNGPGLIYIERGGKLVRAQERFTDERQLRVVIDRIVAPLGRRVDESSPTCDARLPDGSRVHVIIPPLALTGSTVTIRKFSSRRLAASDLVGYGSLSSQMAEFLERAVRSRLNLFISGGTGSGKTTLLNVLSGFIPDDERIVTIEDAAELKLNQEHVISLESRPPNLEGSGAITIRELVRNSLRMRPDRIIVGEVRGGEALDMLQAMNTGHDGSLATGHANTPRDALARLETMVLMAGMDLPSRAIREQIASAIHVIVQVARLRDGSRKVVRISEITGMEGDVIAMQDLFVFDQEGIDASGAVIGRFRETGLVSHASEQFARVSVVQPS
jgi:pilus assembly protein CpaF